jgi:hypothetical protein
MAESMTATLERTMTREEVVYWATDYADPHTRAKLEDHADSELRTVAKQLQDFVRMCATDEGEDPPERDDPGALAWVRQHREELARWLRDAGGSDRRAAARPSP